MRIPVVRAVLSVSILCGALQLQGCAMYSETRHKQAVAAKEAWEKVDLDGQLAAARRNEAALLAEQLQTEDELQRAGRDALALNMVLEGSVNDVLMNKIKGDLGGLLEGVGKTATDAKLADNTLTALRRRFDLERRLKEIENEFARFGVEMPACSHIIDGSAAQALTEWIQVHQDIGGKAVNTGWTKAKSYCPNLAKENEALASSMDGSLKTSLANIDKASTALEASRQKSLALRNRYRAASAAYDAALKELEVNPTGGRDKVDRALADMQSIAKGLTGLQDAFSTKLIADARVDALNELVAAVKKTRETGQTPENANTTARILSQFPELYDEAQTALADAQKPRLAHLVLMKNLEKVRAEAAARDVESQLLKERLLREKFSWEVERLRALRDGYKYLALKCDGCLGWSFADALRPVS